jgi:hypothetical protein
MLRSYLRLMLFAFGLLFGVQVPGLINAYSQRVEAHMIESRESLKGFDNTARQFFNGDLNALVAHYRSSDDPVFRGDAESIANLLGRSQLLESEWQALQGPWYSRAWHVLAEADPQLRQETLNGYTWQVLLAPEAIIWGVCGALVLALILECLIMLPAWTLYGRRKNKGVTQESWR